MTVNKSVSLENVTTHNKIKKLHYTVIQLVLLKKLLTRVSLLWRYLYLSARHAFSQRQLHIVKMGLPLVSCVALGLFKISESQFIHL